MISQTYRLLLFLTVGVLAVSDLMFPAIAQAPTSHAAQKKTPNIIYILADDLGYGDVHCLNPTGGKIKTPHLDEFARQSMVFTDAHSGSSVCTPTRYGIMTGRYAWRTRLQSGVLGGYSPPLIDRNRLTVPALLKRNGYATICIGKWHLGMTLPTTDGRVFTDGVLGDKRDEAAMRSVNWTGPIQDGPLARGFDAFFGITASLDMPPFLFIRNDRATTAPTVDKRWLRSGPAAADFEAVDVLPKLIDEACDQIGSHTAAAKLGKPFFIYLALSSPHTPVLPNRAWKGRSGLGDYADFVMQTDAGIGQVLDKLTEVGLAGDTLVVVTSDNGFSPAGDPDGSLRKLGHKPSAQFRGFKSDIWDGGHRIPFMVRWPGKIKAGSMSGQLVCLTDLIATCADLLGVTLPDNAGEDSASILPVLLGRSRKPVHEAVVHHSIDGNFAIRQGKWKLNLCPGSGGWSDPGPRKAVQMGLPTYQLYAMDADEGESANRHLDRPDVVEHLIKLLDGFVSEGRSTPGKRQANDAPIDLLKTRKTSSPE